MPKRGAKPGPVTWDAVRELALALPGAEEGTSYGTSAVKVRGKLFVRLHQDGDSIVVKTDEEERAKRMRADPSVFYITDHYRDWPWMLVRLAAVGFEDLRDVLVDSWRRAAPPALVAMFEEGV